MITAREVEIRAYVEAYNDRVGDASLEYLRLALDLLDAARIPTEIIDIARAIIEYGDERVSEARAEIAPLRTPPEVDAMLLAQHAVEATHGWGNNDLSMIERVARALTEYGAQRAREADTPPQSDWLHKKRGTTYQIIGEARAQIVGKPIEEDSVVVVYRSNQDGSLWVRPREEFYDGRFEQISTPPQSEGGEE